MAKHSTRLFVTLGLLVALSTGTYATGTIDTGAKTAASVGTAKVVAEGLKCAVSATAQGVADSIFAIAVVNGVERIDLELHESKKKGDGLGHTKERHVGR